MGIDRQLDREIQQIENDESLSQKEKNKRIREAELGAGDAYQQYLDEQQALDGKYGI